MKEAAMLQLFCLSGVPALSANIWEEGNHALLGLDWPASLPGPPIGGWGAVLQGKPSAAEVHSVAPIPTFADSPHQWPTTKPCVCSGLTLSPSKTPS